MSLGNIVVAFLGFVLLGCIFVSFVWVGCALLCVAVIVAQKTLEIIKMVILTTIYVLSGWTQEENK